MTLSTQLNYRPHELDSYNIVAVFQAKQAEPREDVYDRQRFLKEAEETNETVVRNEFNFSFNSMQKSFFTRIAVACCLYYQATAISHECNSSSTIFGYSL